MRVMVLVKASDESENDVMPSAQLLEEMGAFNEELIKAGVMLDGAGLRSSRHGKRIEFSGKSREVVDGPFAETKELLAGYWLWEVRDMAEAVEWARRCPNPHRDAGTLEIRPVFEEEDFEREITSKVSADTE